MTDSDHDPRVPLAIERTLLAWIRTGLALMGFGFVVARLGLFLGELAMARGETSDPPRAASLVIGGLLLAIGALVNVTASIQHSRAIATPQREALAATMKFAVAIGIVTGMLGFGLVIYLAGY